MSSTHHAIEIILTRPVEAAEVDRARRRTLPLAVNADCTRLLALVRARTVDRAFERLRRRVGSRLPIDVLTTHYPDENGEVSINVLFSPASDARLREIASRHNQSPSAYLKQVITVAVAGEEERRASRLQSALAPLLKRHSPEEVLLAAARTLTRHRPATNGSPPGRRHRAAAP